MFREMGDVVGKAGVLHDLSAVARDRGDYDRAAALLQESLRVFNGGASRLTLVRHAWGSRVCGGLGRGPGDETRTGRQIRARRRGPLQ